MATINQDPNQPTLDAIDSMFNGLAAVSPFNDLGSILGVAVPQEMNVNNGQIQPVGWVQNADPDIDGGASVTIDADGITILNGKIFLSDLGGNSVLGPAGFDGSWIGFLADRFYNSNFAYGTDGVIPDSLVGTASTVADYIDSLSSILPYWIIDVVAGTGSPTLITDTTASGGKALKFGAAANEAQIFQDVPVTPGRSYDAMLNWKYANSGGSDLFVVFSYSWRDKDHVIIGTEVETGTLFTGTVAAYENQIALGVASPVIAPASAAYLRVGFTVEASGANASLTLNSIRLVERVLEGLDKISFGGDDVVLELVTGQLVMTGGQLYINVTTDASLAGGGGLIIGNLSGENIVIDGNEIMARANGAATQLDLNREGGDVVIGAAAGSSQITLGANGSLTAAGGNWAASGVLHIGGSGPGYIELEERSLPTAPASNEARIFIDDNGSGKTRLRVRFATGAVQLLATEP